MKKYFTLLTLFLAMFVSSCSYDDTALVKDMNDLREEVENLKDKVDAQQVLLNALANQLTIVSIEETSEGYVITFSDDSTITIKHGKDGADGENGKDGTDGIDGKDSSIVNVEWNEDSVTFTLSDGTILVLPRSDDNTSETPTTDERAVDLGLSVMWASCNVGANSPEGYGDYFAWGEVSPKAEYTEFNSLTFGKEFNDISGDPQYDAATAHWGGDWRMPTLAEQTELWDNCTWIWTSLNGVNGVKITGPNGNSIFMPAAGYRYGSSSYKVGSGFYCWSSTPDYSDTYNWLAFYISHVTEGDNWIMSGRPDGLSIRPVQNK